jgi:hypothetical protein
MCCGGFVVCFDGWGKADEREGKEENIVEEKEGCWVRKEEGKGLDEELKMIEVEIYVRSGETAHTDGMVRQKI